MSHERAVTNVEQGVVRVVWLGQNRRRPLWPTPPFRESERFPVRLRVSLNGGVPRSRSGLFEEPCRKPLLDDDPSVFVDGAHDASLVPGLGAAPFQEQGGESTMTVDHPAVLQGRRRWWSRGVLTAADAVGHRPPVPTLAHPSGHDTMMAHHSNKCSTQGSPPGESDERFGRARPHAVVPHGGGTYVDQPSAAGGAGGHRLRCGSGLSTTETMARQVWICEIEKAVGWHRDAGRDGPVGRPVLWGTGRRGLGFGPCCEGRL